MTTINDINDLVRILREQPEWAEILRGILLGQELLELPERFAKFVELTTENFRLVHQRLDRMDGRMDNGFGTNYEMKVEKNIRSYAGQQLGLRNTRVLLGILTGQDAELADLTDEAVENGVITWAQNDDLWLSDLIFTGRSRTDGSIQHIAAEVSITAGDDDVTRVIERARTLARIIGQPVTPAVIAANIDGDRARLAGESNAIVMQVPE